MKKKRVSESIQSKRLRTDLMNFFPLDPAFSGLTSKPRISSLVSAFVSSSSLCLPQRSPSKSSAGIFSAEMAFRPIPEVDEREVAENLGAERTRISLLGVDMEDGEPLDSGLGLGKALKDITFRVGVVVVVATIGMILSSRGAREIKGVFNIDVVASVFLLKGSGGRVNLAERGVMADLEDDNCPESSRRGENAGGFMGCRTTGRGRIGVCSTPLALFDKSAGSIRCSCCTTGFRLVSPESESRTRLTEGDVKSDSMGFNFRELCRAFALSIESLCRF